MQEDARKRIVAVVVGMADYSFRKAWVEEAVDHAIEIVVSGSVAVA